MAYDFFRNFSAGLNMKPNTITDVFFDLDHTLWDFDRNSALAFKRVFLKHKIEIDLESFIRVYEPINFSYWKLFREEKVSQDELRRGRLQKSFEHFRLSFPESMLEALSVTYIEELPVDNHLFDGTFEILNYLKEKYSLHIITNGFKAVQFLKLKNSKIEPYFKTVTTSEEVGVKKPNPKIFIHALQKAETSAENSIMIGDTFEADILGAEKVGMKTIFYNCRNETIPGNYNTIHSLKEIEFNL